MNTHHIDPLVIRKYRELRASRRKPADAWRRAVHYARVMRLIAAHQANQRAAVQS